LIRAQMAALAQSGRFEVKGGPELLSHDFAAASATEPEVADAIRRTRQASGYLAEPHTACGLIAAERCLPSGPVPQIVLATAHPSKFPDTMEAIAGERPSLPPRLSSLMTDEERTTLLPNGLAAVERYVEERAGAGAEHLA